jgi:hypothetical protein
MPSIKVRSFFVILAATAILLIVMQTRLGARSHAAADFKTIAGAQTAKQPAATIPKTTSDANADLSGVWTPAPSGRPPDVDEADSFTYRHSPYPMQPWAEEKFNYNRDPTNPYYRGRSELDPFVMMCSPQGPTGGWQDNSPFEIIQSPKRVLIIFEMNHEIRQIWTDGRQHPKDFGHNWMGHSIGHWEGDTLVVDTIGLNDLPWLDKAGHVHSDALHLVERIQRVSHDRFLLNITFDDPKTFTMPWTAHRSFQLKPTWEIEEAPACGDQFLGAPLPLR